MAWGEPVSSKDTLRDVAYPVTEVMARVLYGEARSESDAGRRGIAHVVINRANKNLSEFGGSDYKDVMLYSGAFSVSLAPDTSSTAWEECVYLGKRFVTCDNPIGTCVFFRTNATYVANLDPSKKDEYIKLNGKYLQVLEKYVIGNHTFYRPEGY